MFAFSSRVLVRARSDHLDLDPDLHSNYCNVDYASRVNFPETRFREEPFAPPLRTINIPFSLGNGVSLITIAQFAFLSDVTSRDHVVRFVCRG
jgi:hypothetical protein